MLCPISSWLNTVLDCLLLPFIALHCMKRCITGETSCDGRCLWKPEVIPFRLTRLLHVNCIICAFSPSPKTLDPKSHPAAAEGEGVCWFVHAAKLFVFIFILRFEFKFEFN